MGIGGGCSLSVPFSLGVLLKWSAMDYTFEEKAYSFVVVVWSVVGVYGGGGGDLSPCSLVGVCCS